MSASGVSEPIDDSEWLYRRIPASQNWYQPGQQLSPDAFRPNANDANGISLWRAKYVSIGVVARGRPGKSYYVARLPAGALRSAGIAVVPTEDEGGGQPGHVSIPELSFVNRRSDRAAQLKRLLVLLTEEVAGPFPSIADSG